MQCDTEPNTFHDLRLVAAAADETGTFNQRQFIKMKRDKGTKEYQLVSSQADDFDEPVVGGLVLIAMRPVPWVRTAAVARYIEEKHRVHFMLLEL